MKTHPWNIYEDQLFRVGYGLPLWHPEPNSYDDDLGDVPVEVGSVGWKHNGKFKVLFNSMKPEDHPVNRRGIPTDFVMLGSDNPVSIDTSDKIQQDVIASRTLKRVEARIEGRLSGAAGSVGVGAGLKYTFTEGKGALAVLQPPGRLQFIISRTRIKDYMKRNHAHWLELANGEGRGWEAGLKEEELMFISGVVTTTAWAVIALQGQSEESKEISIQGDIGMLADGSLRVHISDSALPATHHRFGPAKTSSNDEGIITYHRQPSTEANQCLFVHFYKMKRRAFLFREVIQAAAGPHQLPPRENDSGAGASSMASLGSGDVEGGDCGGKGDDEKPYDPVGDLLNHILRHSSADVAFASDEDVMDCFPDGTIPDDIPAALEKMELKFDVDNDGVGMIVSPAYGKAIKRENDESSSERASKRHRLERVDSVDRLGRRARTPPQSPGIDPQEPPFEPIPFVVHPLSFTTQDSFERIPAATHEGSVTALAYSPNSDTIASGSDGDGKVIIYSVADRTPICTLHKHAGPVSTLAFSLDGRILASASQAGEIILWNALTWQEIQYLTSSSPAESLAFAPDGELLIVGTVDGKLERWETSNYTRLPPTVNEAFAMEFIIFSQDGSKMATGGASGTNCILWDVSSLRDQVPPSRSIGDGRNTYAAAFSPDGRRIVTGFDDGSCTVWNVDTGEALVVLREHTGPMWAVTFSPDGKLIASGSEDRSVKVVDAFTGGRVLELNGHTGAVNAVAFSPDGLLIASAAADKLVLLWDARTGEMKENFIEHKGGVTQMEISPDGRSMASGSSDGAVFIRTRM